MNDNIETLNKSSNKSSYVIIAFIGSGIGALLGLIAYVQDWFWLKFFNNIVNNALKLTGALVK